MEKLLRKFRAYLQRKRIEKLKVRRAGLVAYLEELRRIMKGLESCTLHMITELCNTSAELAKVEECLQQELMTAQSLA